MIDTSAEDSNQTVCDNTIQEVTCRCEHYAVPRHRPSPSEVFDLLLTMKAAVAASNELAKQDLRCRTMANTIWGSDNIESEGLRTKSATISLFMQFYEAEDKGASKNRRKQSKKSSNDQHVVTLQHVEAFEHAYQQLVVSREALTLELILSVHAILLRDSRENLPGQIRTGPCYGFDNDNSEFVDSTRLPSEVDRLVALWNSYESMTTLDPYVAAAEFSIEYISVHPMFDGNGRMSRILMNCLLLRYGPFCSALGMDVAARKRYLNCMALGVQENVGSAPLAYEILYATYQEALDCQALRLVQ